MQDQYHHYIPRFLLRNFAIDKYERIFETRDESIIKQQVKKGPKQQVKKGPKQQVKKGPKQQVKKGPKQKKEKVKEKGLLQTYDRTSNQLGVSPIARTYGYQNMYKDLNHKDMMHVEEKLSKLEGQAAAVTQSIIWYSQKKRKVTLKRSELDDLRKFIQIMSYRHGVRWSQFTDEKFDDKTSDMIASFMQQYNLQSPQEVWLQNIREMLDTPHEEIKDNERIFSVDRDEYRVRMHECYLVIWEAGENDEFLITNNGFGIFEGVNGLLFGDRFQFPYHLFYVISPKLVLVVCNMMFRKETGPEYTEFVYKWFGGQRSIFENIPRIPATVRYVHRVRRVNTSRRAHHWLYNFPHIMSMVFGINPNDHGYEIDPNDKLTFRFFKITSETVGIINSLLLNETKPNLVLSFISRPYLYKTIIKFYEGSKVGSGVLDFSDLKRVLFKALNETHQEDLSLRRNITASNTCIWHVRKN